MDFRAVFQQKEKRFWWMDVIYYFVISLLFASVFSYLIFLAKNNMQRSEIEQKTAALKTVGTLQQKEYEETVIAYQKKIKDFSGIFKNHEFASRAFSFMQSQTMPNVWFIRFDLDRKNTKVQLLGQADNMEAFSRQVANFEKNEYVRSVGALNSALSDSAKVQFNISLFLDSKLFTYLPEVFASVSDIESAFESETSVTGSSQNIFQNSGEESRKMITIFNFLLSPEVIGAIDQEARAIKLDVPHGTDVTKLAPLIIISPGAKVLPESYVAQDFSKPVIYRVTAKDGSTQEYAVAVNVLPREAARTNTFGYGTLMVLGLISAIILVFLSAFLSFKGKFKP